MPCDHIMAATASTSKASKSERMRGMHLEGVGPLRGAANKLLYALTKSHQKSTFAPDAARLSQALHLPKRNHTEENFPDLEVPSLTLQMRKQAEQARGLCKLK